MFVGSRTGRLILAGACVLASATLDAAPDAVASFFKGKQIAIVVGSSAGGGYDTYARLLSRHFGAFIPGNPTIVPQNMSGAGSNRAAAYVYSVAAKDGTAIGAIFPGAVLQPLIGDAKLQHDPSKFIYLGNANSDVYVCFARTDSGVKTFQDTFTHQLIIGASNPGATTYDIPELLNSVLGTKFKIVTGYAGSREITLALERGEIQGTCGLGWTGIESMHPDWFKQDKIRTIVQLSAKGHPDLNKSGVPRAVAFAKTDDDRKVIELVLSQGVLGRPYVLPPGVPADRVAALRTAFMEAFKDKTLLAEAAKMQLDIDPMSGEELQALVTSLYATPPHLVARARAALAVKR
jgi:tripartite-type tricarboxylate transporter receptor subunit TctC